MTQRWRLVARLAGTAPLLCLVAACATTGGGPPPSGPATVPTPVTLERSPSLIVEAIVTDKKGAPAQDLRVTDFVVTVDGRPRPGLAVGRLFRGPGADFLAASRGPGGPGEVLPLAEQSRLVVLVIDQASFSPGDERAARTIAESFVGMLGLSDRVAAVALPARDGRSTIDFERADAGRVIASLRPMWGRQAEPVTADESPTPPGGVAAGETRPGGLTAGETPPGGVRAGGGAARAEAGRGEPPERDRPAATIPGAEAIPPGALKAHATSTLGALQQVVRALAGVPGAKTILFLSSGLVAADAQQEFEAVVSGAGRAHARIYSVQVPSTSALREMGAGDLERLAHPTGGRMVAPGGKTQQAVERLVGELSFSYLLLLAPMPGDGEPVPHTVQVTLRQRRDLTLLFPSRVPPWRIAPDQLVTALSPRAQAEAMRAAPPPRARDATGPATARTGYPGLAMFPHDRSVDLLLARVAQYAWDYGHELASIVSEETYKQEVRGGTGTTLTLSGPEALTRRRTLVSDYLLVKVPGVDGWLPFRDVFEVDGKQVRDREDRLVQLFLQAPSPEVAIERANQVLRESARYNIGPVTRTLNVPTLPLWFLEPGNVRRFNFRKADEVKIAGRNAVVLEFTETVRPTFVKTSAGADVPVLGRVWIDPVNGQIYQTRISAQTASIVVKYALRPEVPGLLLPESMQESYRAGNTEITADATYSKYRRFQVLTSEQVTVPKK